MTYRATIEIKPSQIYVSRERVLNAIKGYEIVDFRPPKAHELYLTSSLTIDFSLADFGERDPRFIVRKTSASETDWWK